jgi:hypothetical protein
VESFFHDAKNSILKKGEVVPKVLIFIDDIVLQKSPFDFSDRRAAKKVIRSAINRCNGQMVVLIFEAWVSTDSHTSPSFADDRKQAICVYGETKDDNMMIMQMYEFDKTGGVVWGSSSKQTNLTSGRLVGFFKRKSRSNKSK